MVLNNKQTNKICIVAILKDEERFLDEWICYHRIIGVDHFYLYDDDPNLPLKVILTPYHDYCTVINWNNNTENINARNRQIKAYKHFLKNFGNEYEWVAFIDGDEFIVLGYCGSNGASHFGRMMPVISVQMMPL